MANIYDVAKLARVSTATVSAVVNDQDKVEKRTRERVLDAIQQLHYQPNLYARNLAKGQTRLLGLIISDVLNPYFGELSQLIRIEAEACGYEVVLADTQFSQHSLLSIIRRMVGMRMAGIAIMTSEMNSQVLEVLRNSRTAAVFEDVGTVSKNISNVRIDYEGGIFKAMKYLVDLGHREIIFVQTDPEADQKHHPLLSIRLRTEAFKKVAQQFKDSGVRAKIISHRGPGPRAGEEAIRGVLDSQRKFTAVMAIADPVAIGVLRTLQRKGIRVPEDVSIVGFDNSYLCDYLYPPLTSVNIPRDKLAKAVVDSLLGTVERKEPGRELYLDTDLVVRESATPLAPAAKSK